MFIFKVGRFLYKSCFVLFTYKLKAKSAVWVAEQGGWPGCRRIAKTSSHLARTDGADATVGQDARTGGSVISRTGSHLAKADGANATVGQDARTGDSDFARLGSHLARTDGADAAVGLGGWPGGSRIAKTSSHLELEIGEIPGRTRPLSTHAGPRKSSR